MTAVDAGALADGIVAEIAGVGVREVTGVGVREVTGAGAEDRGFVDWAGSRARDGAPEDSDVAEFARVLETELDGVLDDEPDRAEGGSLVDIDTRACG